MATTCSSKRVEEMLDSWGLGEISVKSLGGQYFLIEIQDVELYRVMEDLKWSYLKEIFQDVQPWSETFHLPERLVWVEVFGVPLHCWNHITFIRLAGIWGSLEALGENATKFFNGEKLTMLTLTDKWSKSMMRFWLRERKSKKKVSVCSESSSEKSLDFHRSCSIEMKDDHVGWDSTFNADCLGKGLHHSSEFNKRKEGSFVGEIEQKGGEEVFKHQDSTGKRDEYVEPKIDSCKLNLNDVEDARQQFSKQNESMGNCCSQVVEKLGTLTDVGSPLVNQGVRLLGNSRAVLDASCMGFKQAELIGSVNNILDSDLEDGLMPETLIPGDESLSWEERVDRLNGSNPGNSSEARDITGVETEMERGSMMEFPEFQGDEEEVIRDLVRLEEEELNNKEV
ncbi:hypothetical protein V6N13_113357 [Hibiscus sabdariffa]